MNKEQESLIVAVAHQLLFGNEQKVIDDKHRHGTGVAEHYSPHFVNIEGALCSTCKQISFDNRLDLAGELEDIVRDMDSEYGMFFPWEGFLYQVYQNPLKQANKQIAAKLLLPMYKAHIHEQIRITSDDLNVWIYDAIKYDPYLITMNMFLVKEWSKQAKKQELDRMLCKHTRIPEVQEFLRSLIKKR